MDRRGLAARGEGAYGAAPMDRSLPILLLCASLLACSGAPGGADSGTPPDGGGSDAGCRPSKTPAELVENPSFECGSATEATHWFAKFGTAEVVSDAHTGSRAVKLTVPDGVEASLVYELDVAKNLGTGTYCSTVWVKGTTKAMELVLRKVNPNEDTSFAGVPSDKWERVPPNIINSTEGKDAQRMLLLINTRYGKPGETLLIDDVDVWVSPSGKCDEPR